MKKLKKLVKKLLRFLFRRNSMVEAVENRRLLWKIRNVMIILTAVVAFTADNYSNPWYELGTLITFVYATLVSQVVLYIADTRIMKLSRERISPYDIEYMGYNDLEKIMSHLSTSPLVFHHQRPTVIYDVTSVTVKGIKYKIDKIEDLDESVTIILGEPVDKTHRE